MKLEDLKAGDKVICRGVMSHKSILEVTRTTKTQIMTRVGDCHEDKWRIRGGYRVGGSQWDVTSISPATPEDIQEVINTNRVKKARSIDLAKHVETIEQANAIIDLLESDLFKKEEK